MKFLRFTLYIGIIMMMIVGCQSQGAQEQQQNNLNNNQKPIKVKQSYDGENKQLTRDEVSKRLVDLASKVPEVNQATAVVAGNYAVVGIDVKKDLDRSRVSSIKYSVAEALRKDPYGAKAVVTADPDIVERLKGMAKRIKNGDPVTGILDELAAIVGRIMPEVPAKNDNEGKAPTKSNDQHLPQNKENQLQKQQKDQSKSNLGGNTQQ